MDYEVRFCCEGCCPQLNVSGNPELTEYYENYPGIYILQEETFNDMVTYKQLSGQREIISAMLAHMDEKFLFSTLIINFNLVKFSQI